MDKGLRTSAWVLSSLALLWTLLDIIGLAAMRGRGGMMGGMMNGMMHGGGNGHSSMGGMATSGMMVHMALTWLVMLGLDAVFVYLVATSRRTLPPRNSRV